MRYALLFALLGHLLCGVSDCLLGYSRSGRLDMRKTANPEEMASMFADMPPAFPAASMLLGTFAIGAFAFGYLALARWMSGFSAAGGAVMLAAAVLYPVTITAHHVLCGAAEWLYLRLDRTPKAREAALALMKLGAVPMVAGYLGLLVFTVTLFVLVVSGRTPLPAWACVANTLVLLLPLLPTRLPAKENIAGAAMFLGLLLLL